MNGAVNRRGFVASVAAVLPMAGAAFGLAQASPIVREHGRAIPAGDPVFDQVLREMVTIHTRGQQHGFTGTEARAMAAQLRTAAVRATQIDIDAAVRPALPRLVNDRSIAGGASDDTTRRRALEALTNGGVTGVLLHAAGIFDHIAASLDRVGAGRVRRVQSDPAFASFCWQLLVEIELLEAETVAICAASSWSPGVDIVCPMLQAALSTYSGIYFAYCG
jgi:hypothetical protein